MSCFCVFHCSGNLEQWQKWFLCLSKLNGQDITHYWSVYTSVKTHTCLPLSLLSSHTPTRSQKFQIQTTSQRGKTGIDHLQTHREFLWERINIWKPWPCRHRYSYITENQGITKMSHTEASLQWGLQHKCNMFRVVYFYDPWVEVWRRRRLTRWSLLLHIKKGERITLKSVDHLLHPRTCVHVHVRICTISLPARTHIFKSEMKTCLISVDDKIKMHKL